MLMPCCCNVVRWEWVGGCMVFPWLPAPQLRRCRVFTLGFYSNLPVFSVVRHLAETASSPISNRSRWCHCQEIFMNIIEKQGAVTRLITAIQNRMLKETCLTSHICNKLPRFQRKLITWRIFLLDTPPFKSLWYFFQKSKWSFFGDFPLLSSFSARSYVPQCWKPSSFSCSPMNIQPGTSTGTDSVELMDHGGNFRTWVSVFLFEFEWYEY